VLREYQLKEIEKLDPEGWRRKLISKENSERVRTGDVVRVIYTTRTIPTFIGQVIAKNQTGLAASLVLRNQVNKIGVELKVKLFSPLISRIDIIRRPRKYRPRNKQYYIRDTKLDVGDLETSLRVKR
jgi:ribosomal protein L19